MGICRKLMKEGVYHQLRYLQTSFVVGLSFHSRVVYTVTRFPSQMRTRITAVKRSWGHEETDMALLMERDDDCKEVR